MGGGRGGNPPWQGVQGFVDFVQKSYSSTEQKSMMPSVTYWILILCIRLKVFARQEGTGQYILCNDITNLCTGPAGKLSPTKLVNAAYDW